MKVLALVGTGIKTISHLTEEAKGYICSCDKVLYLVNEPLLESYLKRNAKVAESFESIYFNSKLRKTIYDNIAKKIHDEFEKVNSLCVVIYGHPCIFATPGLLALSTIKTGFNVKTVVCPAISALDCLYSDLRFDPAIGGTQLFDATEYLVYEKTIETTSHVIFMQIGMVGNLGLPTNTTNTEAMNFIKDKLIKAYKKNKIAIIYEAALYPHTSPKVTEFELCNLDKQDFTPLSTLYIPPEESRKTTNFDALKFLNK